MPNAFVISFKLETDEEVLVKKSKAALSQYGHQVVIGNMLATRKKHVVFVSADGEIQETSVSEEEMYAQVEIESKIVHKLVEMHRNFIEQSNQKVNGCQSI